MLGPVVGAVAIIYLNEQLREFGQWRTALYGLLLMFLFLYFKQGIVPKLEGVYGHRRVQDIRSRLREQFG
jgi:branched-chain amino acid transport system permease protein